MGKKLAQSNAAKEKKDSKVRGETMDSASPSASLSSVLHHAGVEASSSHRRRKEYRSGGKVSFNPA